MRVEDRHSTATQLTLDGMDQFRADAERLSHIIMEMQRCLSCVL